MTPEIIKPEGANDSSDGGERGDSCGEDGGRKRGQ